MREIVCRVLVTSLLCAVPAGADTVELANGDRVTGTVLRLEAGELVVATEWAGELAVDWGQVAAVTTDGPLLLVLEDETEVVGALHPAGPPAPEGALAVATDDAAEPLVVERTAVTAIHPADRPAVTYEGHVAAGFVAAQGNTETESLYAEGEVVRRTDRNRYTLGGQGARSEDDGRETADNARAWIGYDRFLTDRWYLAANALAARDEFQDLSLRTALSLSTGYQFLDTERTALSGELGASYVDEDFDGAPDDSYPAARWAVGLGHDLVVERVELFHSHEGFFGLDGDEDLLLRSRTGLRFHLFEGFVAAAQVNLDYDESPAPGREEEDRKYLVNLGFEW